MLTADQLQISARSKSLPGADYLPLEGQGLSAALRWIRCHEAEQGNGQAELRIQNCGAEPWEGVLRIQLTLPAKEPRFFLPGFLYGRNRGEAPLNSPRKFPRLRREEPDFPASSWWMVRSDQLSHPAAFLYEDGMVYGLAAQPFLEHRDGALVQTLSPKGPFRFGGFCCSLEEDQASVGYTLGYENAPWLFIQSTRIEERKPLGEDNCICLAPGEQAVVRLELISCPSENETGFYTALERVYRLYHQRPRTVGGPETAIRNLSQAVYQYAWLPEERCYSGFVREDGAGGFTYNKIHSLTWTNGLTVAVPLLMAADTGGDEQMRAQALTFIEDSVAHCMNPASGLPFETRWQGNWSEKGWWYDGMHTGGHSGYLIGQAVYYLLKAYEYEKNAWGCIHEDWLDFARRVLERVQRERNSEGEYPFALSAENGAGLEYDSMGGAWCLAAWADYCRLTGRRDVLPQLEESEGHYYRKYVARAECYGGPLDTDKSVDNEAVLAYIRAVCQLHRITGESVYLAHMRDALSYEFSFKFCYNVPVQTPPLSEVGWSSCGGSITSTANPHIHPMSSTILGELQYYVDQTGDDYVKSRLEDTLLWGCQTYNTRDGEYGYGKTGWMSERVCYGQGLLVERYPDGSPASTWFALMPWAACSVLEGLVDVSEGGQAARCAAASDPI